MNAAAIDVNTENEDRCEVGYVLFDCALYNRRLKGLNDDFGFKFGEAHIGNLGGVNHIIVVVNDSWADVFEALELDDGREAFVFIGEYSKDDIHKAVENNTRLKDMESTL